MHPYVYLYLLLVYLLAAHVSCSSPHAWFVVLWECPSLSYEWDVFLPAESILLCNCFLAWVCPSGLVTQPGVHFLKQFTARCHFSWLSVLWFNTCIENCTWHLIFDWRQMQRVKNLHYILIMLVSRQFFLLISIWSIFLYVYMFLISVCHNTIGSRMFMCMIFLHLWLFTVYFYCYSIYSIYGIDFFLPSMTKCGFCEGTIWSCIIYICAKNHMLLAFRILSVLYAHLCHIFFIVLLYVENVC